MQIAGQVPRSPLSSFPRIGNDVLCRWIWNFPGLGRRALKKSHNNKAKDFSSASLRLVPSPRYFANLKTILQWGNRIDAGRTGQRRRARTHYSILERAEVADASLVWNQRVCRRLVARVQ